MIEQIMETVLLYSKEFAALSKENPMLAGALGLYGAGIFAYFTKDLPSRFISWVKSVIHKQFTISVRVSNIETTFYNFMDWYESQGFSKKSRTLRALYNYESEQPKTYRINAGLGNHYFIFNKRIFKLTRVEKDMQNSKDVKEEMVLTTYGRSRAPFDKLFDECNPDREVNNELTVFKYKDGWDYFYTQEEKDFDTVVLRSEIKDKLISHIETFHESKDWYIRNGIPYRTGILLQGPGGTGKTSIVKALCSKFNKRLCILSLGGMTDSALEDAMSNLRKDSIILIEDIDAYGMKMNRDSDESENYMSMLTMSGILNALDGIAGSPGRIVIATTNHPEKLDKALTRPGRFDINMEIGYLTDETFLGMFEKFYPEFKVEHKKKFKKEITPAEFQILAMSNLNTPIKVLRNVLENV